MPEQIMEAGPKGEFVRNCVGSWLFICLGLASFFVDVAKISLRIVLEDIMHLKDFIWSCHKKRFSLKLENMILYYFRMSCFWDSLYIILCIKSRVARELL